MHAGCKCTVDTFFGLGKIRRKAQANDAGMKYKVQLAKGYTQRPSIQNGGKELAYAQARRWVMCPPRSGSSGGKVE